MVIRGISDNVPADLFEGIDLGNYSNWVGVQNNNIGRDDGHEKFNSANRAYRKMVSVKPKTVVTMNLQGTCTSHSRTEVAVSRGMFGRILARIARLRAPPVPA